MQFKVRWMPRRRPKANLGKILLRVMARAREEVPRAVAQRFLERLQSNWYGQSLPLAPISEAWRAKKARLGWDQRILIATERLVSMMDVFRLARGKYLSGLKTTMKAHTIPGQAPSQLPLVELMQILEHGSDRRKLPARPIFRLTLLAVEGELRRLARQELNRIKREEFARERG